MPPSCPRAANGRRSHRPQRQVDQERCEKEARRKLPALERCGRVERVSSEAVGDVDRGARGAQDGQVRIDTRREQHKVENVNGIRRVCQEVPRPVARVEEGAKEMERCQREGDRVDALSTAPKTRSVVGSVE